MKKIITTVSILTIALCLFGCETTSYKNNDLTKEKTNSVTMKDES